MTINGGARSGRPGENLPEVACFCVVGVRRLLAPGRQHEASPRRAHCGCPLGPGDVSASVRGLQRERCAASSASEHMHSM